MILKVIMQKCICVILAILCSVKVHETTEITTNPPPLVITKILNDDKNYTWTSVNFPNPYPSYNQDLIIKADFGFSILITIEDLDIDSKNGDFLVIKPGTKLDDEGQGKVFIYNLKSEQKHLVRSNNVYLSLQVYGKNENVKKGFSLVYERIGEEVTTTTANPTTVVTWPTPSGSDSIYYTSYVSGKTEEDFKDNQTLLNFKTAIAEMATEYCNTNNFVLTENITEQNIQMYYLIQCSYVWPDSDNCMKARFAVPVLLHENSTWSGYQLTTSHLEQMWIHLGSTYLKKYDMDVYSVPNNSSSLTKWVVISAIVLILFLMLLYLVKLVGRYISPLNKIKRRASDTTGFETSQNKISNASLAPHHYQSTPELFDNDDYPYAQFDIDLKLPKNTTYTDSSHPFSEDDSDFEIFDNSKDYSFGNSQSTAQNNETYS